MSKFVREELTINGVKTVVHTAGKGEPLPGSAVWAKRAARRCWPMSWRQIT